MSNWTWEDLVNMRAYQPVERRAAGPEWQPHDPQDYRDRYPMAPDPSLLGMINPARSTGIGGILESPPLAGPSRGVAAVMRGENPLRATADMTGASPELWEELQARGVNPLLALGAEVAVPSMLSVIGDVSDVANVGRWAASNWDNLAPLAASLFPASKMAWNAPVHLGWQTSLMDIFKHGEHWDPQFRAQAFIGAIHDHMPSANLIDDGYIKIASRGGTIEVAEHGGNIGRLDDALEIYINGNVDPDDIARFIDLADAGGFSLITGGKDAVPYALAHRLGFVEESLGGGMIRMPVPDDAAEWYVEMTQRLGGDSGGELFRASGLKEGDMVDELSVLVHRNTDLSPGDRGYWIDRILEPNDGPNAWEKLINDMTDEGIIPRIPGEDFVSRNMDPPPLRGPTDDAGRRVVGAGGFNPGNYDADDLADWAAKIKRAQEDAIRRGSPYTIGEWKNFLDIEGVRVPTGDPDEPFRRLNTEEIARLHAQFAGDMGLPVELSDAQVAQIVSSEFGLPVSQDAIRDADRVLYGLQDSMAMQENAISLLRSTDVELTPKIAGNVLESFFAIRPEDIGRTGDELIEWMDSVQRAYRSLGKWSPGAPRYNINEVLSRGLADLKTVASRPMASGGYATDYDLLVAVRRMGSDADGLPNNVFDVVDELHKLYPTIPLEQLESIAEMALL